MKKLILTTILLLTVFSISAQDQYASGISVPHKIPLIILILNGDTLNIGQRRPIDQKLEELIESFDVFKGKDAISMLGDGAGDGLIAVRLFNTRQARKYFKEQKKYLNDHQVNPDLEMGVDERTGFSIGKPSVSNPNDSNEPAKLRELRPGSSESGPIFIMSLNGKERLVKNSLDLEKFASKGLKSIEVLKDEESKTRYNSKGKDIVIATFESSKATKKFFRTLKRVKKK